MISNNKIRQKEDDHFEKEAGSFRAFRMTPVSEDSPSVVSQVKVEKGVKEPIVPINNGTRNGYYEATTPKDKNLRDQFVDTKAIEGESR